MKDIAHELTNEALSDLEKELTDLYSTAYADVKSKLISALEKIEQLPIDATPTQRYVAAQKFKRLESLEKQLTEVLHNVNAEAMKISQGVWVNTYAENYNYAAFFLESATDKIGLFPILDRNVVATILKNELTPFSLMALDDITDRKIILRDLTRELVTGISSGESMPQIAKRIKKVADKNYGDAIRIARTETQRVENSARYDVYTTGEEKYGIKQEKEWVATNDGRTRRDHARADGQRKLIGEPFIIGGHKMMYPGDPAGGATETIRCRCTTVPHIIGFEGSAKRVTYNDWKEVRDVRGQQLEGTSRTRKSIE